MKALKGLRWTVDLAAAEFGRHHTTISSRLKQANIQPGEDGKFSTKEIGIAVFGDIDAERLKRARKENHLLDIEIGVAERKLIPADFVQKAWEGIITGLRQAILFNADIPEAAKREILTHLPQIPIDEYFSYAPSNAQNDSAEDAQNS